MCNAWDRLVPFLVLFYNYKGPARSDFVLFDLFSVYFTQVADHPHLQKSARSIQLHKLQPGYLFMPIIVCPRRASLLYQKPLLPLGQSLTTIAHFHPLQPVSTVTGGRVLSRKVISRYHLCVSHLLTNFALDWPVFCLGQSVSTLQ